MKFSIGIDNQQYIFDLQGFLKDPSDLLKTILVEAVAYSENSFNQQGLHNAGEWTPPSEINIAGIWRDVNQGKTPPSRRIERGRKALMDTGLLRRSITWRLISKTEGQFGSNVPYAADNFFGGDITINRMAQRKEIEKRIEIFIKKYKNELSKHQIARIRRLKKISVLKMKIPARPFLGIPEENVLDIVGDFLEEKFGVKT